MRVNAAITSKTRRQLSSLIAAVNKQRARLNMPPSCQTEVINELVARAAERPTNFICGVLVQKGDYHE